MLHVDELTLLYTVTVSVYKIIGGLYNRDVKRTYVEASGLHAKGTQLVCVCVGVCVCVCVCEQQKGSLSSFSHTIS